MAETHSKVMTKMKLSSRGKRYHTGVWSEMWGLHGMRTIQNLDELESSNEAWGSKLRLS